MLSQRLVPTAGVLLALGCGGGDATDRDAAPATDGAAGEVDGSHDDRPDASPPARRLVYAADWDGIVVRGEDLDQDGDMTDDGELVLFWQEEHEGDPLSFFTVAAYATDAVLATDFVYGSVGPIHALVDANGDGDAMDAGEQRVWFEPPATDADELRSPGVVIGLDGEVYVLYEERDPLFITRARILRLRDANGDGDAQDAGESTQVAQIDPDDLHTAEESFTSFAVDDEGTAWLWGDWGNLYRVELASGAVTTAFRNETSPDLVHWSPGPDLANVADGLGALPGGRVVFHAAVHDGPTRWGLASAVDEDQDDAVAGAGEVSLAWHGGTAARTEGVIGRSGAASVLTLLNAGDAPTDKLDRSVVTFTDLDQDGDFDDDGEQVVLFAEDDLPVASATRLIMSLTGL